MLALTQTEAAVPAARKTPAGEQALMRLTAIISNRRILDV